MIVTYERNALVAFVIRNLFYLVFFFREIPSFKIIKTRQVDRCSLYSKMYSASRKM